MDPAPLLPVVNLVALQFLLHALGWAAGAWLLRQERQVLAHWCAFLALEGLGFALMSQRDDSRTWWAFNGAALCWIGGLLALWRGLARYFDVPARDGWQLALLAAATLGHFIVGSEVETATARVVLSYGSGMLAVALMLLTLFPALRPRYGLVRLLFMASPALILMAAFGILVLRQLLDPSHALELHRFDASNLRSMFAYLIAAAIFNFVFIALVVGQLLARLRVQSERDVLTGLYNRRVLGERLAEAWHRWQRQRHPFALVLVDLDHFKRVNDTRGHPVGDEVLVQVAQRLRGLVRGHDVLARMGGEEFIVLMPQAGLAEAAMLGDRLCRALREAPLAVSDGKVPITASVGLAQAHDFDRDADSVLRRADAALYRAKDAGRDRVEPAAA